MLRQRMGCSMVSFWPSSWYARWRLRLLFFLTATLVLSVASEGQVSEAEYQNVWKEYVYSRDGFAITLPSEPSPHKDAQFPHLHINVYSSGGVTLRVSYARNGCESQITTQTEMIEDYASGRKEPDPVFRVDAASIKKGNLEGHPFLEYEQEIQKSLNDYERWYCVEKTLYIFSSDWHVGPARPANVDRIVRSFRLLKKTVD